MKRSHPRIDLLVGSLMLAVAVTLSLIPAPAAAQAVSGTILGTVRDTTGASVPAVTLTLTHTGTGQVRTLLTNSAGEYTAPSIATGMYTITGEMSGFKTVSMSNIRVGVDQKVRVDLKLELGEMTEAVEIVAEVPLVQTSSSDLSATIVEEQIKTLPLNGRNFVQLTRTIPGVGRGVPGINIDGGSGSYSWRATASFSANGQRPRDNNYLLDGVDNNESWLNTIVIYPSTDALAEFKVQTSTYSAEFGRSMGGVVNLQIKSGTNEFHGSVFEFLRNDKLDANDWFNNRAGRRRPDFSQHQFGATLGGPIRRDKTFFFADYQGFRVTQGLSLLSTVPSVKMRAGDFSEINRVIYDPLTRLPFPGNVIPPIRWDPASKNIIEQLYPAPNTPGSRAANGQPINNYLINPNLERQDNQFDVKIDHALTPNNRIFARYSFEKSHRNVPGSLPHGDSGANPSGFGSAGIGDVTAQSLTINDTHSFSDRWLNEFRLGWASIEILAEPVDFGLNLAQQVGILGINLDANSSAFTQLQFQNIRNMGATGNQPLVTTMPTLQFVDNVTHIRGRHTLKGGASVMFRKRDVFQADSIVGVANFNNNLTSNCAGSTTACTIIGSTGFDVASFLLGYASSFNRTSYKDLYTEKRPEISAYVQDDFRVNSKLTLNVGLRWDLFVPYVEENDRQSNFDTSTGRFVPASEDAMMNGIKVGRYLQTYSKKDFAPRLGFAYDVTGSGRTIVRGGFGIFWNTPLTGTSSTKAQNPPFLLSNALSTSILPTIRLSAGLPPLPPVDPNRIPQGTTRSTFDPNYRDGRSVQWNVNVQRQIGQHYMAEVGYVGSAGRDLQAKTDVNQARPTLGVTNPNVNRPFFRVAPGLTNVYQSTNLGELDYHALQVKFVRRFANNFSFFNAYTFGKAIDLNSDTDGTSSFTNVYDIGYNRGPADYDITHTFTSNWIYELPFARNTKLGGWQVSGLVFLRSGYPFTVTQSQGLLSTGTGNRPNRIGDGKLDNPTIDRWFDLSAFAATTENTATYGNSGRNILRGPGQFNVDASLIKITRFGRIESELRIEAFNLLNHPAFALPNAVIGNSAAGTISALLPGTPMRQVQVAMKLKF